MGRPARRLHVVHRPAVALLAVSAVTAVLVVALGACGGEPGRGRAAPDIEPADLAEAYRGSPGPALLLVLDCPTDERVVFQHDRGEPPPDATVRDALGDDAAGAEVVEVSATEVLAVLSTAGQVTEVLVVRRWGDGGWAVDGGSRCQG